MKPWASVLAGVTVMGALVGLAVDGWAGEGRPEVALPLMKQAPTIDGVIHEEEWAGAVRHVGFVGHATRVVEPRRGVFWIGCDGRQLYIALRTETPPDGRLLIRAVPDDQRDIRDAFADDSIEVVLDPKRGRPSGSRKFYHFITNARGALYDCTIDPDNRQNPVDFSWRLPAWTYKNTVHDGWWDIEIAIPLTSLEATADDLQRPWGVRLARNWKRPYAQSQWESEAISYEDQPTMPVVTWDGQAPVVQVLSLEEGGREARIRVAVRNPHDRPLEVKVFLSDAWHQNQPSTLDQTVTVAAGGVQTLTLTAPDNGPEGLHRTVIRVTSPDGRKVYYHRDYRWSLHRPKELWSISEEQKKAIDLQFKYYPYYNKVRFRVSVETLAVRDRITGAEAVLGPVGGQPLWRQALAFDNYVSEGTYDIPELKEGKYELQIRLRGGEGVPTAPVVQPFVRQHFQWEHNTLGRTEEVMPPFTPMQVKGPTVACVLREHEHDAAGLWRSVRSQGRELLTAPMTWEVVSDQAVHKAVGAGWKCLSSKPHVVTGEAAWSAGPLKARVRTEYDYDGLMLVTLTLEPTGAASVERLTMCLPVRDREARYMHAVGDGLRHNYAGFVPSGTGRIWDSSKANRIDLVGTFFPYLWVGGGERGLAWFADTDRDWRLDDATPVLDLTREGETLLMRVHFMTKPGPLTRPHTIVFGLQATPTKPMPEGWRRWTAAKAIPGARPVRWVGATLYWGGLSFDLYPFEQRYIFFDKLKEARLKGQADWSFVDVWMKVLEKRVPPGSEHYQSMVAHTRAGLHSAAASPWREGHRLFGYTNARGVAFDAPEFATFQDEWLRYRYFNRDWDPTGAIAYDVSPSESFQDWAVWCYRRMLDCFDGVYWDNTYLSAHYDPVVGGAWTDDRGRVHPGLGLFHLRGLVKRTAVMHWQESKGFPAGRKPLIQLSHMTNTMIVPVLSFGNCNMDWEWKYGLEDFQDRFSPDLTVAETIARQVGAWPTILAGGHPDPKDPRTAWMWRTRLAVCLVHELHHFDYGPKLDSDIYARLFEFGYGTDACRVYNYWDEGHPAVVSGVDARTLVLAREGAAIVVVTDYGQGGTAEVKLDLRALGLRPEASAADLETEQAVDRVGPGVFRFPLKKHDFRILRVK